MMEAVTTLIGSAFLGIVAWAFSLHSRVGVLEQKDKDLKELIEVQFEGVNQRLDRIERALYGVRDNDYE